MKHGTFTNKNAPCSLLHALCSMTPTHHANLIPHAYSDIADALRAELGDVELIEVVEQTLSIESARDIIDMQFMKSGERNQVIIIAFDTATREAQNALLKVVEEPVASTYFFIVTPNAHLLLPTLRSRLSTEHGAENKEQKAGLEDANKFLKSSVQERLEIIKPLIEEKDRRGTASLIKDVTRAVENSRESMDSAVWSDCLRQLNTLLSYSQDPASSPKMLLEHLAGVVPVREQRT